MTEILGTPTSLSMRVSRKLSDGQYGSFEVSAELEVSLAKGVNLEDSFQSLRAWLEVNVGKTIKAQKAAYDQLQPAVDDTFVGENLYPGPSGPTNFPDDFDDTPQHTQAPVTAPGDSVVSSVPEQPQEVWQNPTLSVAFTQGGKRYLRVKTAQWPKWGAKAWVETVPFDFQQWDAEKEYYLPDGLQDAVVLMKVHKGKLVPDKVLSFQ